MYPFPYLDSLYLGNLNLNENLSSSDPKFHEFQKQACELEDQVESKLNLLDKDLFHAMLHNLSSGHYRLRYAAQIDSIDLGGVGGKYEN